MKTRIVAIGNSRGLRIPKPLLDQYGLEGEVEMNAVNGALVIRPVRKPRWLGRGVSGDGAPWGRRLARHGAVAALVVGPGGVGMALSRFEVYLVSLDPAVGSEIRKTRPCLVISPNEMNRAIRTVIVAPMTTKGRAYPTRVACRFRGKDGQVVLDQMRTIDRARLVRKLGRLDRKTALTVLQTIQEMFAL